MSDGNLAALRARLGRIERPVAGGMLPFATAAIDRVLPGGGLARGAVHEILGAGGDEEDGAAPAGFVAGIAARLGAAPGDGVADGAPVLWCQARPDLYGPGLARHGLDPARIVRVAGGTDAAILWAIEEGLRSPGLAAVVGEVGCLPMVAGRRLQLAAERSGVTVLIVRRWHDGDSAARERRLPSTAVTRWRVTALPAAPIAGLPGIGRPRWRLELLRCRGGAPAEWEVEVADATGHVCVPAGLADRPAPQRTAGARPDRRVG